MDAQSLAANRPQLLQIQTTRVPQTPQTAREAVQVAHL